MITNSESSQHDSPLAVERAIYSVSQLARDARNLLTDVFPRIWVEGEISNLAQPASGHIYFTLKDNSAQLRCAMFRSARKQMGFNPQNGDQVLVQAQVSLYEARGDFQLIVEQMEAAGDGALQRAFEQLKKKLLAEGLFSAEVKRPLPTFAKQVGVITSPTGAAIRDILAVLKRRFPALPVIIYPTRVQGEGAGAEVVAALQQAEQHAQCDVLILARGGGSLEDLWAFNEEIVAHAIYALKIPVISGVGHEVDTTIADFVADFRAPTPSAAAEAVSQDQQEWLSRFAVYESYFQNKMQDVMNNYRQQLSWSQKRLQQVHPKKRIQDRLQRIDELDLRMQRLIQLVLQQRRMQAQAQSALLMQLNPLQRILRQQHETQRLVVSLRTRMRLLLEHKQQQLSAASQALNTVSPLATLARGYAIVTDNKEQIVRQAGQLKIGDQITARLGAGVLVSTVEEIHEN